MQGAESQLSQVADRKLADKDVINQGDATQIARAEAKLNDGQIPPNSISAKAQVDMITIVAFLVSVCNSVVMGAVLTLIIIAFECVLLQTHQIAFMWALLQDI